jgi:hypothetical protein
MGHEPGVFAHARAHLRLALLSSRSFLAHEPIHELRNWLGDAVQPTLPTAQRHGINAELRGELRLREIETLTSSYEFLSRHERSVP